MVYRIRYLKTGKSGHQKILLYIVSLPKAVSSIYMQSHNYTLEISDASKNRTLPLLALLLLPPHAQPPNRTHPLRRLLRLLDLNLLPHRRVDC